ncbi:MAG: hypothetical protein ACOC8M_02370 [Guyparkeria sp.]
MDELTSRLKRAAVLAETHGALAPMSWAAASRRDLIDGMLAITEDQDGRLLAFVPRGGGLAVVIPVSNLVAMTKRASAFNTVVDVEFDSDDGRDTICIVGPRGRMKKIAAAAGHPL